jgi:hypothetical protein
MHTKSILAMLMLTAATLTFNLAPAEAANVSVNISGYLPAPPGVLVRVDADRPYYVENERRVYMEKEKPAKYRKHHKEKKHHDDDGDNGHHDNGNHYGNDKHGGRGH